MKTAEPQNKRVLIVWSELPEKVCLVPLTVTQSDAERLINYNNQYINSCGTPDELQDQMNKFFYDEKGYFKFKDKEETGPIINEDFDLIVQCGFIL